MSGRRLALGLVAALAFAPVSRAWEEAASGEDPRVTVAATRVEEQDILGQLDRIDRQLQSLIDEIAGLQEQLDRVEARRLQAEDSLAAARTQLEREAEGVATRCAALYRLTRRGLGRALFDAESPADLRRRSRYLLAVLDHDRARLRSFNEAVERRQSALEAVDRDRSTVAALQAELRIKEASLRDERARRLALLEDVRRRKDLAMRLLAERSRAGAALQVNLGASNPSPGSNASFRAEQGRLPWPTTGQLVRSFGHYTDPLTGERVRNTGIRIEAAYGTPFRAVFEGVVRQAGFIRGYGQTVVVEHGAFTTVYAHANGLKVSVGQPVAQGEVLGFVGNSGLVDTPGYLLHFEIRYNGTPQDPVRWLSPAGRI